MAVLLNEQKDLARIVSCVLVQCIVGGILYIVNLKHARKAFCWDYVKFALLFNLPLLPWQHLVTCLSSRLIGGLYQSVMDSSIW